MPSAVDCRELRPSADRVGWSVFSAAVCRASAWPATTAAASRGERGEDPPAGRLRTDRGRDRRCRRIEVLNPGRVPFVGRGLEPGEARLPVPQPHVVERQGRGAAGGGGKRLGRVEVVGRTLPGGELALGRRDAHHPQCDRGPGGLGHPATGHGLEHCSPLRGGRHREADHRAGADPVVALERERGQRLMDGPLVGQAAGDQLHHPAQGPWRVPPGRRNRPGRSGARRSTRAGRGRATGSSSPVTRRARWPVSAAAGCCTRWRQSRGWRRTGERGIGAPARRDRRQHEPGPDREDQAEQQPGPPVTAGSGRQHQQDRTHRPSPWPISRPRGASGKDGSRPRLAGTSTNPRHEIGPRRGNRTRQPAVQLLVDDAHAPRNCQPPGLLTSASTAREIRRSAIPPDQRRAGSRLARSQVASQPGRSPDKS